MPLDPLRALSWDPPPRVGRLRYLDAHTGGEPFRVLLDGPAEIPGATHGERRLWAIEHLDALRRATMLEPRGHADMYGCLLTPPVDDGADFGILFLHNEGFSTMCGHGIVAIVTVVLETGMLTARSWPAEVVVDTAAGRVRARAEGSAERVRSVSFRNVPSFVLARDRRVEVAPWGAISYDLAFGGAFYAFVDAAPLGLALTPDGVGPILAAGRAIKRAVVEAGGIEHPTEPALGFLYGVVFTGPSPEVGLHSRHACVFADGEVDRSPTGTALSARLALLQAGGGLTPRTAIVVDSLLGSRFTGSVAEVTTCGALPAVIPEIRGEAWITGRGTLLIDPNDRLGEGFLLR
jgi:trans-L-3-hydroxyproline dehydratase